MATRLTTGAVVPLASLAEDWVQAVRAERTEATARAYEAGVKAFLRWHTATYPLAEPVLDRKIVREFTIALRGAGQSPGTCRLRHAALRRFSSWLYKEGEAEADVLLGMRPPKLDKPLVPRLTDEEVAALVRACKGPAFTDRRDEALVRLMTEGLLRAFEALALTTADVDVHQGLAVVRKGKGGKGRLVPFGPATGTAVSRYLRIRRRHPLADTAPLWLPGGGRPTFGYQGLAQALGTRAKDAGVEGFHLHRLRHTGASRWLAAGGNAVHLKAVGGWSSLDMVGRYTEDDAARQAIEQSRKLGLDRLG